VIGREEEEEKKVLEIIEDEFEQDVSGFHSTLDTSVAFP